MKLTFRFQTKSKDAMDILPNFDGISVHDGLSSYAHYNCEHGLCNAHHLRELLFIVERYEQLWAALMLSLLVEIKDQVEVAKADRLNALTQAQLADFEHRYQELIEQGLKANPPPPIDPHIPLKKGRPKQSPAKNLLDRLQNNDISRLVATCSSDRIASTGTFNSTGSVSRGLICNLISYSV